MQGHAVTSGRRDRSSLSLSTLCGHPRHCRSMPGPVTTSRCCWSVRGQDVATTATVPRTGPPSRAPSNRPTDGGWTTNHYAATLEAAPVRAQDAPRRPGRGRICQDGCQLRGTTRHASTHREIVRHACKLLPPLAYKRRGSPPATGDTGRQTAITHTLSAFSTILPLASINTSGTWRPGLLSHHACSPPLRAPQCEAIQ
jgi:hypothetical protein